MCEINNPSSVLLSDRTENPPGTVVVASLEGTRPILVELQALATLSVFGFPKRTANGIDFNRLTLLIAVLEKRAGLALGNQDVYMNIIGGIKIGQVVRCVIEPNPSCKVYFDSGENYICQNFVKGNIQLTLGTVDYYDKNDPPYKASTVSNGLIIENVRENTKVKIGVAWVCDASENDLRTWFAADPTYITE